MKMKTHIFNVAKQIVNLIKYYCYMFLLLLENQVAKHNFQDVYMIGNQ